jgi:hypothetical protein
MAMREPWKNTRAGGRGILLQVSRTCPETPVTN